jgi:hypothetical protein
VIFRNKLTFYDDDLLATRLTLHAGGPPLVGSPRLLIQYIHSYPPCLEGVSSIRNMRTRHAVVTRDPPNMDHTPFHTANMSLTIVTSHSAVGVPVGYNRYQSWFSASLSEPSDCFNFLTVKIIKRLSHLEYCNIYRMNLKLDEIFSSMNKRN